jgi:hypothetical protein
VERDALNFFQPFEPLPPNRESPLTRALLVALRLSPLAHQRWLGGGADPSLLKLSAISYRTRRRAVRIPRAPEERVPVISVFLAPKAPLSADVVVRESAREQVLDTVIEYGDTLVLVVENKAAEAGWDQRST